MTAKELINKIPKNKADAEVTYITEVSRNDVSDKVFKETSDILYEQGYDLLAIFNISDNSIEMFARERTDFYGKHR